MCEAATSAAQKLPSGKYRIINARFKNDIHIPGDGNHLPKPLEAFVYDHSPTFWVSLIGPQTTVVRENSNL